MSPTTTPAAEWTKIDSLVQDIDKQIERLAGTAQQPQPETVYINAVKELRHARQMRDDIEEHVKDVEAGIAAVEKDKLLKSAKLVRRASRRSRRRRRLRTWSGTRTQGGIQVPPEPVKGWSAGSPGNTRFKWRPSTRRHSRVDHGATDAAANAKTNELLDVIDADARAIKDQHLVVGASTASRSTLRGRGP